MSDLLDEHAAAARLALATKTLTRWRCAGIGPAYYKIGGRLVRYATTDLDAFTAAGRVDRKIDSAEAAQSAGIPVIECVRLAQRPGWACDLWVVSECPYCRGRHVHGAGEGLRTSHCAACSHSDYYLVEERVAT